MRQMPKVRIYPRGRPHKLQRFFTRALNTTFAFWRLVFATLLVFAIEKIP
jgi:hypothetical protein